MPGSRVLSENTKTFPAHPGQHTDVLITAPGRSPVVVEAEYDPAPEAEQDAAQRLGLQVTGESRTIESAIALRYPVSVRDSYNVSQAVADARLSYCVLYEDGSRFPESGWLEGPVAYLVRLVSVPQKEVDIAADPLQDGIEKAAVILDELKDQAPATAREIARLLGMSDVPQTRRMACAIVANALVFHERIAGKPEGVKPLSFVCGPEVGNPKYEGISKNRKWTTLRTTDPRLVERAKKLTRGELYLPQRAGLIEIPIMRAGTIARVGPVDRDITGRTNSPFRKRDGYQATHECPMLWNHNKMGQNLQSKMLTKPDSHGEVRPNRDEAAEQMWNGSAAHLHINRDFQFNANATAAAFTDAASLGGRAWPTLAGGSLQQEKALCVWINSTLGMISHWMESNRNQDGRGGLTVTAIPDLPVLDVTSLAGDQLDAAVEIFDDMQERTMLPTNKAWRYPVRQELDRRLLNEVLGLDEKAVKQLGILRRQWCSEPTVTSTKKQDRPTSDGARRRLHTKAAKINYDNRGHLSRKYGRSTVRCRRRSGTLH